MHTTAHPDDEHGGVIARLSRGDGARLALLTLNRGEAGDNAIGSELFEGLGLVRTEELLVADRYYGVDDQYFATMIDYGYSKRLDEALGKWGKENVQRDVVRAIRLNRPFVLISRFQGTPRDGHGQHMAAGLVTQEAFKLAGDPAAFPEQIKEGLRPWQPMKVYIGGLRENEDWTLAVDAGEYSPWLGETYQGLARRGLSFQRSQTSGRVGQSRGPAFEYYRRVGGTVIAPDKEKGFFDGIDTTLPGLYKALGRPAPAGAAEALAAIDREVTSALAAFRIDDPAASVPALARGLAATRRAIAQSASEPDAVFVLKVKERQFADALDSALGIDFAAVAQPWASPIRAGPTRTTSLLPPWRPPRRARPSRCARSSRTAATGSSRRWRSRSSLVPVSEWRRAPPPWPRSTRARPAASASRCGSRTMRRSPPGPTSGGLRSRKRATRSAIRARSTGPPPSLPSWPSPATRSKVSSWRCGGWWCAGRRACPTATRSASCAWCALAVPLTPAAAIIPRGLKDKRLDLAVELLNNREGDVTGQLGLDLPAGWTAEPARHDFRFAHSGERRVYHFGVSVPALESRDYTVTAVARAGGKEFRDGYEALEHRDLETRYLYRRAASDRARGGCRSPGRPSGGLRDGGGRPGPGRGLAQPGVQVTLLGETELATGKLSLFDAIMTGTRAYAVREDLKTWNQRLLDYVKDGGNLIVLYNTQEFVPDKYAPFPARPPPEAEEVSEEDSPVEILAGAHPAFNWPNRITPRDFEGWVEQRGSKFFTTWDPAYTAMIATHDTGQEPQRGGWCGRSTARATTRTSPTRSTASSPYGVPGAYRLLANLLCLNKTAGPAAR